MKKSVNNELSVIFNSTMASLSLVLSTVSFLGMFGLYKLGIGAVLTSGTVGLISLISCGYFMSKN